MGPGEVWMDDVQLFNLAFSRPELVELSKLITLADVKLQNGQVSDCLQLLEGYWPQFLEENVRCPPESPPPRNPRANWPISPPPKLPKPKSNPPRIPTARVSSAAGKISCPNNGGSKKRVQGSALKQILCSHAPAWERSIFKLFSLFPISSLRSKAYGVFRFLAQPYIAMINAPAMTRNRSVPERAGSHLPAARREWPG